jgi:dynein heavy chain 1
MRQYAAFEYVQETVRALSKANPLVAELKSEALRERHWAKLYKALRMPSSFSATSCVHHLDYANHRMTLGQVYDLDLKRNETLIREVTLQAQGEVRFSCGSD